MTGLAAFLLSDIISFGLNPDHNSALVGLEHNDPITGIMSIINWNENYKKPAVPDNPVVQKGGLISLSVANSSPKMSVTGRLGVNISGEKNGSLFQMDSSSLKAKGENPSNSSPMPNSFSSNRVSSGSAARNTASGTSSNKLVNEKGAADLIKTHSGSSRETPISQSPRQKDIQKDPNYANDTQLNRTQVNSTQVNSMQANSTQTNFTQVNITQPNNTQANSTQADRAQLINIQADNISTDQLKMRETSTIKSTINETSMSQPQINQSTPKSSQITLSQINAAEADPSQANPFLNKPQSSEPRTIENPALKGTAKEETAKEETKNGNSLSENENTKTKERDSRANPVAAPTIEAQNTVVKTALTKTSADIRVYSPEDPAKDVSAKNTLEIKFRTDSITSSKSEDSPGGVRKGSGAVSGANAAPSSIASESSPVQYKKNDARESGDSTSISKSPTAGKESGSARKPKPAVTSKTEKAQEIRYQKIANKNRLAENAKKKAATARERAR
jgi:hypothetical protein